MSVTHNTHRAPEYASNKEIEGQHFNKHEHFCEQKTLGN